jgi:NADPH-dependent curcumin reductase CurA
MEAKALLVASYCNEGIPSAENFRIESKTVDVSNLTAGEFVVRLLVLSADPYMRNMVKQGGFSNRTAAIGSVLTGFVAGEVIDSKSDKYPVGMLFGASLPFQTVMRLSEEAVKKTVFWNLTAYVTRETISHGIGLLGMPGATVYGGLMSVLRPKAGETIFISGAAGAVGGLVGMLAKNVCGCRVVGSCGGAEKVKFVTEKLGFDAAIDYKACSGSTADLRKALAAVAPDGIDMYFDNVGAAHFEAAFQSLRAKGRIAVCGGISEYNRGEYAGVSINPLQMIYTEQRVEGFVSTPYLISGEFLPKMKQWIDEKKITVVPETTFTGIDAWPEAFQALFTGANTGKVVVYVDGRQQSRY